MSGRWVREVTISSGSALSDAAEDLKNYRLAAIQMPSSWTNADITFQAIPEKDGTYQDVHDDSGSEHTVVVDTSQFVILTTEAKDSFNGFYGLKVRSGTSTSPTNQGSDRTLKLVFVC